MHTKKEILVNIVLYVKSIIELDFLKENVIMSQKESDKKPPVWLQDPQVSCAMITAEIGSLIGSLSFHRKHDQEWK